MMNILNLYIWQAITKFLYPYLCIRYMWKNYKRHLEYLLYLFNWLNELHTKIHLFSSLSPASNRLFKCPKYVTFQNRMHMNFLCSGIIHEHSYSEHFILFIFFFWWNPKFTFPMEKKNEISILECMYDSR